MIDDFNALNDGALAGAIEREQGVDLRPHITTLLTAVLLTTGPKFWRKLN